MIRISGVSFLWEAIDAGYRGHTSISNRELDGHSRFIIPRRSLRAWKIRCCCRPVSSRSSPSISSPRSTVCPFRSAQEPLHKWPCPSFKITTNDQGRASPPFDFNFNFNFLPSFLSTLWSVPLIVCHVWTILLILPAILTGSRLRATDRVGKTNQRGRRFFFIRSVLENNSIGPWETANCSRIIDIFEIRGRGINTRGKVRRTKVNCWNECLVELEIIRFFSLENSSIWISLYFFNFLLSREFKEIY